jgi:CheY-like chemotaxis protein
MKPILVCVDDEVSILQMLQYQLENIPEAQAFITEFFSDSQQALQEIITLMQNQMPVALVLVDYQMPKMNGNTFVRELKSRYPGIPVIMLSGQANESQIDTLLSESLLTRFLSKPWTLNDLQSALAPYSGAQAES